MEESILIHCIKTSGWFYSWNFPHLNGENFIDRLKIRKANFKMMVIRSSQVPRMARPETDLRDDLAAGAAW